MTIVTPTGRIYEDYPNHVGTHVRTIVLDDIFDKQTEMWIDPEKFYNMVKYRADDMIWSATPSSGGRPCQRRSANARTWRTMRNTSASKRNERPRGNAVQTRCGRNMPLGSRHVRPCRQLRNMSARWRAIGYFLSRDLPPPDRSHNPFFGTDASRALHDEERARFEACLATERRRAGLGVLPCDRFGQFRGVPLGDAFKVRFPANPSTSDRRHNQSNVFRPRYPFAERACSRSVGIFYLVLGPARQFDDRQ